MVRTPCFYSKQHGFDPWSGNKKIPQAPRQSPKRKKKKKTGYKNFNILDFLLFLS